MSYITLRRFCFPGEPMSQTNLPKLEKGKPLSEAKELLEMVRGSYEYLLNMIHRAFYAQFSYGATERDFWVVETFQDYLIVKEYGAKMPPDEYYQVYFKWDDAANGFNFTPIDEWVRVLLAYQVPSFQEQRKALTSDKGTKFNEIIFESVRIEEAAPGKPRKVKAVGAYADQVNSNGRRYSAKVMREAVADARQHLNESLSQGRAVLLGEAEHPSDKGQRPRFLETIVAWKDLVYDERTGEVHLEGQMVESSKGRDAIAVMDAGVLPGISLRGYGESKVMKEGDRQVEEVLWLKLTGFDMVLEPSFTEAGVTKIESKRESQNMDEKDKNPNGAQTPQAAAAPSAAVIYKQHPDVAKEVVDLVEAEKEAKRVADEKEKQRKLEEMRRLKADEEKALREALGVDETADLQAVITEREQERQRLEQQARERQVKEYVESQTDARSLNYTDETAKKLRELVMTRKPQSVEEAKRVIAEMRGVTDQIMASVRLAMKGRGISLGPVIESELGIPEFAKAAFEITEALHTRNLVRPRDRNRAPVAPSDHFLTEALRVFDEKFKSQLIAEARMFAEAETLSDLSLPYSVSRAIMQEAYPMLISPNVFDWGVAEGSPISVYYESQFAGESGTSAVAVTNEVVNAAALDTWYSLAHKRINFTGINMTNTAGNVTYTFGTDYVIDFEEGRVMLLDAGSMSAATNYHLDYTYEAMRKGENTAIAKAKAQLLSTTMTQSADRLATEVSREAVVFSRSQLGWDAAMQTVSLLIKEIAKKIDANLLTTGLSYAAKVASNTGGAWNSSSDTLAQLVEKLNAAKTKIQNRNYTPTAIVMSTTNANKLVLYDKFTQAGATPGFVLNDQEGFLGQVLGLPVFHSTQFPDSFAMVLNRQLILRRVFQPMLLRGPYPSYDADGLLKANDQYYVEEFNGHVAPIAEKASYITIS